MNSDHGLMRDNSAVPHPLISGIEDQVGMRFIDTAMDEPGQCLVGSRSWPGDQVSVGTELAALEGFLGAIRSVTPGAPRRIDQLSKESVRSAYHPSSGSK